MAGSNRGRLCAVAASVTTCSSVTTPYASGFAFNTAQQLTGFNYGNGVTASYGYSPDRLQMTSLSYANSSATLFSLSYSYGTSGSNNGMITSITDNVQSGRTASYSYDALGRITAASTTGSTAYPAWALNWTYDRYGNRTSQTIPAPPPTYCTFGCPTDSLSASATTNQITNPGFSYDANGNTTNDGYNAMAYDAENRTVSASNGSSSGAYVYDGNGLRVQKSVPISSPTTTTIYIFSGSKVIAEYDNGAAVGSPTREYLYAGTALVATVNSTGTHYHHGDHLSPRLTTDSSGNSAGEQGHFPFGESWYASSTTTKFQFTSYERDAESGNDYAMARYNENRLGRFSSPDPFAGGAGDPQSLNRYSYTRNNPINLVDPSGMFYSVCQLLNNCRAPAPEDPFGDEEFTISYGYDPNLGDGGEGGGGGTPAKQCILNIKVNNRSTANQGNVNDAESQIRALFGSTVGVNFVTSGPSDFTLDFTNGGAGDGILGESPVGPNTKGNPTIYFNDFSPAPPTALGQTLGTVAAHELTHKIAGVHDLPFNPSNPADLMSLDSLNVERPSLASQLFYNNGLHLTTDELQKLLKECQKLHP